MRWPVWPVADDCRCETSTTRKPRARVFFVALVKRTALSSGRFVARPARSRDMLASRKSLQRGFRNVRRKLFFEKRFEKFPQRFRITAGLMLRECSQVIFKRSTWAKRPQAVLKDSCLVNTLGKMGFGRVLPGW